MEIGDHVVMQVVVGGGATLLFIALVVFVGLQDGTRGFEAGEAMLLVGVIVAFVVLLAALGLAVGDRMDAD